MSALKPLNTRSDKTAKKKYLRKVLDHFYDPDNDEIQQSMEDMVRVGSAMFLTGTQYLVVKNLLCDPNQCSSKVVGDEPALKQFKN